jgi:hypothetical protein
MIAGVVASAAASAAAAKAQADQAAQQKTMNNIQNAAIVQARQNQDTQAQQKMIVANDQAEQQLEANKNAERQAVGTATTSFGESGISGNSVDALANEYHDKSDQYATDVEYNRNAQEHELDWAMKGFNSEADSRVNSLKQPVYPSLLSTGLQIAGSAASAYGNYTSQQKLLSKGGGTQ